MPIEKAVVHFNVSGSTHTTSSTATVDEAVQAAVAELLKEGGFDIEL
ncbi:MAG: hypothetical protein KR126chlam2_00025 [Chlamydiae bacterium]|nr:hypothetical protein [Chlamydiota bacterium]